METWILRSRRYNPGNHWDGYYTGRKYTFQGEQYAVCEMKKEKAKKYTSYKRALNAVKALNGVVVNYIFDVVMFSEV